MLENADKRSGTSSEAARDHNYRESKHWTVGAYAKDRHRPLPLAKLKMDIEKITACVEEWQRGLKYATAIVDHIENNIYSGYYEEFSNTKGVVAYISSINSRYSFARTQFVARLYGNVDDDEYDISEVNENCNRRHENSRVDTNRVIPLLLAWGLHIKCRISFRYYLIQNIREVALAWVKAASIVKNADSPSLMCQWFASATDMFLRICIGESFVDNLHTLPNGDKKRDLKTHCLKVLDCMQVRHADDTERSKLVCHLIQVARQIQTVKATEWLQRFSKSLLIHILELSDTEKNFAGPTILAENDSLSRKEKSNVLVNADAEPLLAVVQELLHQIPKEALIGIISDLLSRSNVGSNIHWKFLQHICTIIKDGQLSRHNFFIYRIKQFCVDCLKACKSECLASTFRFLQHLSLSPNQYTNSIESLFLRSKNGKNSGIAPNSLRVQALTSPSNPTKENSPENVESESAQLALDPSKRTFSTFLKSIEFLVPSDSLEFLILHKRVVLLFRSLYRSQCADLIGLIKTRIEDLRLALSKSEPGVSIQANIANDVVAYVEAFFESGGNIPHALLQTALFRKQFFTKHFLPVLLSNTQAFISQKNFDFHVEKRK